VKKMTWARLLLAAGVVVAITAGVALAGRGQDQRLRRLHFPPPPQALPGPLPAQPDPATTPPVGGGGGQPPPPPPPPPLPRTVAVDENEYSIGLSRTLVGAGTVTFNVYNRGMDDHDLAVVDVSGNVQVVAVPPREMRSLVVQLGVGRTRVYCSLFGATPASHEALGMSTTIDVG
jgi:hypothetical protein